MFSVCLPTYSVWNVFISSFYQPTLLHPRQHQALQFKNVFPNLMSENNMLLF